MLLVHAEAQALLRKELIDSLGIDRARGLLTRMGYASGAARRRAGAHPLAGLQRRRGLHDRAATAHARRHRAGHAGAARARSHGRALLRRIPVGELLGRAVAPAPLRPAQRAGVLDADRLRLRLRLGLHGPADPVQGNRMRRHGPQQLPHHRQAGRGMGGRRRTPALLHARSDRRPVDRPADAGRAAALDHRRQGQTAGRHDRHLARLQARVRPAAPGRDQPDHGAAAGRDRRRQGAVRARAARDGQRAATSRSSR